MALSSTLRTLDMLRLSLTRPSFMIHLFIRYPLPANHLLQRRIFDNWLVVT